MANHEQAAEHIFGEAQDLGPGERGAFLDRVCCGQPALRSRVEVLLEENDRLSGFLSEPAYREENAAPTAAVPAVAAGTLLLERYRIVGPLGSGGMGVVYRARDEKLKRDVAIKMLQPGVLAGNEGQTRFRREAQALAKINHVHIASVYDVIEQDGADCIVMELVAGESLAAKLRGGALPVREATTIALQIAEALEEAHEQGVIHRDLKPANVMITPKGQAKVLDFGLARLLGPADVMQTAVESGRVMGTPLYMSPEQAIGQKADARSDLWSLGVTYYQSLTGVEPFRRPTALTILRAITDEVPQPVRKLCPQTPPLAEEIVARALEKDPELRYQQARDFATDLRRVLRDLEPRPVAAPGTASTSLHARRHAPRRRQGAVAAIGIVTLAGLLTVAYLLRAAIPPPHVTGTRQLTHDGIPKTSGAAFTQNPIFTDGSRVYFEEGNPSEWDVMQVSPQGGESERVPLPFSAAWVTDVSGTQSKMLLGVPLNASATIGALWTMPLPAGQAQRNGALAAYDATWAPDADSIYYSLGPNLWVARDDGSHARKILTAQYPLDWIRFSRDGRRIRFSTFDEAHGATALWEAQTDGSHLQPVLAGWNACCGSWTPDGKYFVFASTRSGAWNLWAMREKRNWWRMSDQEPVQLTVGQMISESPLPSPDGKTIFFLGSTPRGELVRYDLKKRVFEPYLVGLSATDLAFSRDGSAMAWVSVPEATLWQGRADGSDRHELTFAPMRALLPRWSPDGTQIAFAAREPGKPEKVYIVPAAGGSPQQVTSGPYGDGDPSWSPGGDALAFGGSNPFDSAAHQHPIEILNLKTRALTMLPGSSHYFSPRWSPDGRWLLALDDDTFAIQLYDFATRSWGELTNLAAGYPNWSSDSRCVQFIVLNGPSGTKLPYYRICLADRKPQLLVKLAEGGQLVSETFNFWTGVTPDGSILGIRDISIEEVYALDVHLP